MSYHIIISYRDLFYVRNYSFKIEMKALNGIGDHISDEIIQYLLNIVT